jgi:perosamine synthetase
LAPDDRADAMTDASAVRSIPMARPNIGRDEIALVESVLRSGTLSLGERVVEFEATLAAQIGRAQAIACSSGTAGLHLAVRGLGIADGDEVITTPFSFVASANCVLYERAKPRFVDIEEVTLGLDPELVDAAAGGRTRALLPVHVFGKPCRIEELASLASDRGWFLIEDACEALGSASRGRPMGSFGDASVLAFYPNKQITTGEGGMVLTDDPELRAALASMRNQGRDADGTWLRHVRLGFNYRLDELSAALGVVQVQRLAELRSGRDGVVRSYEQRLRDREWVTLPTVEAGTSVDWFVYVVRLAKSIDRDRVITRLASRGIPARPYFSPLHLQPFYRAEFGYRPGDFPVTERVASSTLALPFSSLHTDDDIDQVCKALIDVVADA